MITERTIINVLIIGAGLILAPFLISSTLVGSDAPLWVSPIFYGACVLALAGAFFFLKDTLCICPLLGMAILGSLNFLPLPLTGSNIACIVLILYYITGYVIIRKKRITVGKPRFFWPMIVLTLIVLYHNHSLSVGVLGGDTEGGKNAILLYLTVLAYFCGINISSPSVGILSKIPLIYVILTAASSIPFLLTTYFPGLAPYLYSATSSVNVAAYFDSQGQGSGPNSEGNIGRLAVFGPLGTALELYLLCHYPILTWLRPERWWIILVSLFCAACVVASGYRSELFGYAFTIFAASWCYYSWRTLFLPAIGFIALILLLIASSNNLIQIPTYKLPMIAQRTLSFLPGEWDNEALESAKSSNFFRQNIQDVYIREYMNRSPLIGNGFYINKKEYESYSELVKSGDTGPDPDYVQAKAFIEGKMYHTGWISVYDCVGIVGFVAFVIFGWNQMWAAAHFVFGRRTNRVSSLFPLYVWLFANVTNSFVSFFTVFGDIQAAFASYCIYGIVLSQLYDIEKTTEAPAAERGGKVPYDFAGLRSAHYGYQSR